jgi:hypothetical protein
MEGTPFLLAPTKRRGGRPRPTIRAHSGPLAIDLAAASD